MRINATAAAAILVAGWTFGASAADTGLATSHQQKPAAEPQQNVPGPTPQETSKRTDSDKFVGGKDQGRSQEQSGSSGSPDAGARSGATKIDGKALASPDQQKAAHEPQQPVPGDTPQETSAKADHDKVPGGDRAARDHEMSGSSGSPEKDAKKDGAAK